MLGLEKSNSWNSFVIHLRETKEDLTIQFMQQQKAFENQKCYQS